MISEHRHGAYKKTDPLQNAWARPPKSLQNPPLQSICKQHVLPDIVMQIPTGILYI